MAGRGRGLRLVASPVPCLPFRVQLHDRGLSIWQIGDMTRQKVRNGVEEGCSLYCAFAQVSGVAGQWIAESMALDGDLLVACFQGGGIMKAGGFGFQHCNTLAEL